MLRMKEILMTITQERTDVRPVHMSDGVDRCESEHNYAPCSGVPTHRLRSCYLPRQRRVCAATAAKTRENMLNKRVLCFGCNRLASDCWTLLPIS